MDGSAPALVFLKTARIPHRSDRRHDSRAPRCPQASHRKCWRGSRAVRPVHASTANAVRSSGFDRPQPPHDALTSKPCLIKSAIEGGSDTPLEYRLGLDPARGGGRSCTHVRGSAYDRRCPSRRLPDPHPVPEVRRNGLSRPSRPYVAAVTRLCRSLTLPSVCYAASAVRAAKCSWRCCQHDECISI
jgi:hypothetical protein